MPHTYLQDAKRIIDSLSTDEGLILEEKLILLDLIKNHLTAVTEELESELSTDADGHEVDQS